MNSPAPDQNASPGPHRGDATQHPSGGAPGTALLTQGESSAIPLAEQERDTRLDRLSLQLDVLIKVRSFRVEDLLALRTGAVVETVHEHSQDVPLACGGAVLVWGEVEVIEQKLGVRITRLA